MKFTIAAVNQLGLHHCGLIGKIDLVDWALLDYISTWSFNSRALKHEDMVWVNYAHVIEEMPVLGLKTKSAISNRIKKLRDLDLVKTYQDEFDKRLYVKVTSRYADAIGFTLDDIEYKHLVHQNEHPSTGNKPLTHQNAATPTIRGGVHQNEQGVHQNEQGVHQNEHSTDTSITDKSITDLSTSKNKKTIITKMGEKIDIQSGLDLDISSTCLKSFIDHRALKKSPLTQHVFDGAMVIASKSGEVNMTPEEILDFTMNAGWTGVNINYTRTALSKRQYGGKSAPVKQGFQQKQPATLKTNESSSNDIDTFFGGSQVMQSESNLHHQLQE